MALRLSFFLLVFANLVFFAWTQGYLGDTDENREPQRLTQQLNPEALRILPPAPAATAAKQEEPACRIVNGLAMTEAEALKAAMAGAGLEAQIQPQMEPKLHLVVIVDLPTKAATDKKIAELARLGVTKAEAVALDDGRHEIVLGRFSAEAGAREFVLELGKKGLKSARADSRDQPPRKARVEARGPGDRLLQQLPRLIAPYAEAGIAKCEA